MKFSRLLSPVLALGATAAMAGNMDVSVGGQFKGELRYDDQKITKHSGNSPKAATTNHAWFNAQLKAKVNDMVSYSGDFRILNDDATGCINSRGVGVKTSYLHIEHSNMVSVSVGCIKRSMGGWKVADRSEVLAYDALIKNDTLPILTHYMPGFNVMYNGGMWSLALQISDDVQGFWNQNKTLAPALDFRGNFGGVQPILQIGLLDAQHSRYVTLGVKGEAGDFKYGLDVTQFELSHKVAKSAGSADNESKKDTILDYQLSLAYAAGMFSPFLTYSAMNNKQHTTDVKSNTFTAPTTYTYDDNARMISLGTGFNHHGEMVTPYVALDLSDAKFMVVAKEETLKNMMVRAGVTAHF